MAALWEQLSNIANAKQGNSTNNEWYERFNTKVEVAKSVGVSFNFETIWEYCAMEAHKATYTLLRSDKQEAVRVSDHGTAGHHRTIGYTHRYCQDDGTGRH